MNDINKRKRDISWETGSSINEAAYLIGQLNKPVNTEESCNIEIQENTLISAIVSQRSQGKIWRELEAIFDIPQATLRRKFKKITK
tara:strand:- start:1888 stop:2145 length:258 start_codon:yes stop_codon:yes gene_type:complete